MKRVFTSIIALVGLLAFSQSGGKKNAATNNPIFEGWYADPEGAVFDETFWVYPTFSDDYDKQLHFDAFSSKDLVNWEKHERILDTTKVKWLRQALWAPSIIEKEKRYYLFFGANDIQRPGRNSYDPNNDINHFGGIGVAVADNPAGPFEDYLGEPLISDFYNGAQPIDQFVFKDIDGTYYFMWSEGNWTNGTYKVAYAMADKATGPYKRIGTILESKENDIATGAGHHSVVNKPGTDEWVIVYHRRPKPNEDRNHRVTCMDVMEFNIDGIIKPVKMTFTGVRSKAGNLKD